MSLEDDLYEQYLEEHGVITYYVEKGHWMFKKCAKCGCIQGRHDCFHSEECFDCDCKKFCDSIFHDKGIREKYTSVEKCTVCGQL